MSLSKEMNPFRVGDDFFTTKNIEQSKMKAKFAEFKLDERLSKIGGLIFQDLVKLVKAQKGFNAYCGHYDKLTGTHFKVLSPRQTTLGFMLLLLCMCPICIISGHSSIVQIHIEPLSTPSQTVDRDPWIDPVTRAAMFVIAVEELALDRGTGCGGSESWRPVARLPLPWPTPASVTLSPLRLHRTYRLCIRTRFNASSPWVMLTPVQTLRVQAITLTLPAVPSPTFAASVAHHHDRHHQLQPTIIVLGRTNSTRQGRDRFVWPTQWYQRPRPHSFARPPTHRSYRFLVLAVLFASLAVKLTVIFHRIERVAHGDAATIASSSDSDCDEQGQGAISIAG